MRIARLELDNIGVFEHQIIEFREKTAPDKAEIHILTGVNGSGKSTILYALAGVFQMSRQLDNRFRYRDKRSQFRILFSNGISDEVLISGDQRQSVTTQQVNSYQANFQARDHLYIQQKEFDFAAFAYSGSRSLLSVKLGAIQESEINPLQSSLDFQGSVNPIQLVQWIANTKAKIAFAQQEDNLQLADRYKQALNRIENAITEIVGYPVTFVFRYDPLAVTIKVRDQEMEFDVLPDGLKSIISWIADLLMRLDQLKWVNQIDVLDRNFILFLDEIEIHLHPAWQRKILPVVQKLFKNAQIFIATHSPFVVASVSDAWIYKFVVQDGTSTLAAVEESMAGSSYPTVLDEIFGISEYFDVETEQAFTRFYAKKDSFLRGNGTTLPELLTVARQLSERGPEVKDIVGRELRQLERITGQPIAL